MLMTKITSYFSIIGDIMNTEYFNTTFEEYKVIKPDGTSDYITKNDFGSVQVIHL